MEGLAIMINTAYIINEFEKFSFNPNKKLEIYEAGKIFSQMGKVSSLFESNTIQFNATLPHQSIHPFIPLTVSFTFLRTINYLRKC